MAWKVVSHADAAIIEINFPVKKNAKPKKAGDIAKLVLQREEFDPMFKVCSKIMHRTALSIASRAVLGGLG